MAVSAPTARTTRSRSINGFFSNILSPVSVFRAMHRIELPRSKSKEPAALPRAKEFECAQSKQAVARQDWGRHALHSRQLWEGSSRFLEYCTWPGPGARRARFPAPKFSLLYRSIEVRGRVRANFHGRFLGGARKERPQFPRRAGSCGRGDSNLGLLRQLRSGAAARRSPLAERPGHPESRRGCHRGISRVAR